ncbi:hypothetical protein [Hyalangium sp.]|uniref:amino acid kinase family protein n=1 Tax=Hyalangium sp. TaxID=2028555 RepID=UPI002D5B4B9A|nr:hypothetical protein [Hyalangium sp.]HYH97328.1 hypothetical protein [Hyalangium sp.]
MQIHVMKFGGSSFATDQHFHRVAGYLRERTADGSKVALVVSGLPGATEELRARCLALNPAPSGETIDCLIPLADTIGAAYARAAIERLGVKVTTLYGFQLGLLTDANFSRARILEFDATPLRAALATHDVVVVPGGQARNAQGQQMWMGKNSSDLSAVAVAAALGVKQCEIYSDVCGVYSADPNLISGTQLVPELSYDSAITLSLSGAKVIHHGSVSYARRHGVEILCRLNQDDYRVGTRIGLGGNPAAVVLDHRSVVLEFSSQAELERAAAGLHDIEVPVVDLSQAGELRLVVTCGFFDVERFLREQKLQPRTLERHLATEFRRDGAVLRHLPEKAAAREFSQKLHDQLYSQSGRLGTAASAVQTARRR